MADSTDTWCASYDPTSWSPVEIAKGYSCSVSAASAAAVQDVADLGGKALESANKSAENAYKTSKEWAKAAGKLGGLGPKLDAGAIVALSAIGLGGALLADAYLTGGSVTRSIGRGVAGALGRR